MAEPRIPTMPCPECRDVADPWGWCADCDEAGRVPRPPLSLEQIAALPDGARVVFEYEDPPCVLRGLIANDADRAMAEGLARISGVRVWLAEDADG